jgi:hypothetical protein
VDTRVRTPEDACPRPQVSWIVSLPATRAGAGRSHAATINQWSLVRRRSGRHPTNRDVQLMCRPPRPGYCYQSLLPHYDARPATR